MKTKILSESEKRFDLFKFAILVGWIGGLVGVAASILSFYIRNDFAGTLFTLSCICILVTMLIQRDHQRYKSI